MTIQKSSSLIGIRGEIPFKYLVFILIAVILMIAGGFFYQREQLSESPNFSQAAFNPQTEVNTAALMADEKQWLMFMREEEKLARDFYMEMYNAWGLSIFVGMSKEEKEHLNSLLEIFRMYFLPDPIGIDTPRSYANNYLANVHNSLYNQGIQSIKDGLKACALQEEINILDLDSAIKSTQKRNIQKVYSELQRDSFNHLRSFARCLETMGERYQAVKLPQQTVDAIILDVMDRGFMLR